MSQGFFSVMVVEDNDINRHLLAQTLKKRGYQVVEVNNGYHAISTVLKTRVDLVILDIMMPGISGLDVLRVLRDLYSPVALPIIMATAKSEKQDMLDAFELGANDYVAKPYEMAGVLERVEALLRVKSLSEDGRGMSSHGFALHGAHGFLAVSSPADVREGVILAERYRLDYLIGTGAFGHVYQGTHLGLDHPIAVKILAESVGTTPEEIARFQLEGITTCRIQHPNAVLIYDFGATASGIAYLVMELLMGRSLQGELEEFPILSSQRAADILMPVCDVLSAAHEENIIHRDLKPANVFLHQARHGEVMKVLDFGIAGLLGKAVSDNLTVTGGLRGTPAYMSPERLQERYHDGRSDVYSLGVMLYEMLAGRLPFSADGDLINLIVKHIKDEPPPLTDFNPSVSPEVEYVVRRALTKDPAHRPVVEEFARELAAAAGIDLPPGLKARLP